MTPKIRIKGFSGEWTPTPIKSCLEEVNEKNDPIKTDFVLSLTVKDGVLPYSEKGNVGNRAKEDHSQYKLAYPGTIVLNSMNILIGAIGISRWFGCVSPVYYVFKPTDNADLTFLYDIMSNKKFQRELRQIASGMMEIRQKVPMDEFLEKKIFLPSMPEQQAIAQYLLALDHKISSTEKQIASLSQTKAACLQSMFPQEGETIPRVRFKGFEGEWELCQLRKYTKRITRKNKNLESTLPLTISSMDGLVSQYEYFNSRIASTNIAGYYLLKKGEFAYNKSYSVGYPFGSVKKLEKYELGVLSTLYIVFSVTEDIYSDYLVYFFDTTLWHKEVASRAAEGARNHGLLNIGTEDFFDIAILLPKDKEEQRKIGDYFRSLDQQIDLQKKRLEKLRQIKAACLDNMFV